MRKKSNINYDETEKILDGINPNYLPLYHGTVHQFDEPVVDAGSPLTDFGQGYYLTNDLETAKMWVSRKRGLSQDDPGHVYQYSVNLDGLKIYEFNDMVEWILYVWYNRKIEGYEQIDLTDFEIIDTYDVIIGPIADDKIFE